MYARRCICVNLRESREHHHRRCCHLKGKTSTGMEQRLTREERTKLHVDMFTALASNQAIPFREDNVPK